MTFKIILVAVALSLTSASLHSQSAPRPESVRVFLDCNFCDRDYLQVESPWIAFVRDRTASDVHLLLTRIETGGAGSRYDLEVIPLAAAGRRDTVVFSIDAGETEDAVRREITRNIQLSLVPFALRTNAARSLRISADSRDDDASDRPQAANDPWRAWVFEIGAGAGLEKEQRQSDAEFSGDFEGRRVTSMLKVGFAAEADYQRSRFELDEGEGTVTSTRESYYGGAVVVRSIARQWGLGAEVAASSSTFQNTRLAVRVAPAIEYSLFPYEEATRRQLVFQYSVGISSFQYREETIFDKIRETRPSQALVIGYDVQQPWGSAYASLEASAYLDDFAQNSLEFDAEWDLRIIRGLELEIGGSASLIHDQLSIPKRDATPEEILLERRALGTDYRYQARVGFSYTFGSIFSAVVNPRFGSGPGRIIR